MNRVEGMQAVRIVDIAEGYDEFGNRHVKRVERTEEVTPQRLERLRKKYKDASTVPANQLSPTIELLGQAYEEFELIGGRSVRKIFGQKDVEQMKKAEEDRLNALKGASAKAKKAKDKEEGQ